ncbi:hypothetical protein DN593_28435, partial [Klebsiella pneumoniae]
GVGLTDHTVGNLCGDPDGPLGGHQIQAFGRVHAQDAVAGVGELPPWMPVTIAQGNVGEAFGLAIDLSW